MVVATDVKPEHTLAEDGTLIKIMPPISEVVENGIVHTFIPKDFGHSEMSAENVVTPGRTHLCAKAG